MSEFQHVFAPRFSLGAAMRLYVVLMLAFCCSCPSACSFWFLSHMRLGAVGGSGRNHHSQPAARSRVMCELIPSLTRRQSRICNAQPEIMRLVYHGARQGISECHQKFSAQRWNCTTYNRGSHGIGKIMLKPGSREAAFVNSISTAGVVHSLAQGCAKGALSSCSCDNRRQGIAEDSEGEYIWGGCSHNFRYAARFTRRFFDAGGKQARSDPMTLMNHHNNRAGRKAVQKSITKTCKCHGISGACTTRTCWRTVGSFAKVGEILYSKYGSATQVNAKPSGEGLEPLATIRPYTRHYDAVRNSATKRPVPTRFSRIRGSGRRNRKSRVRKSDLVFFEESPDYCKHDVKTGSIGTDGRRCNVTSTGPDNCDIMCCGRGYDTKRERITEKCHCRFTWCCKVECKMCTRDVDVHTCKPHRQRSLEPRFAYLAPAFYQRKQTLRQ